jgi:hypothetical protein
MNGVEHDGIWVIATADYCEFRHIVKLTTKVPLETHCMGTSAPHEDLATGTDRSDFSCEHKAEIDLLRRLYPVLQSGWPVPPDFVIEVSRVLDEDGGDLDNTSVS